jgi:signal peptidase I
MTLRWFFSKNVRRASEMRNHVRKLLQAQRDILAPNAVAALENSLSDTARVIRENPGGPALQNQLDALEKTANKSLKPYPHAEWRENVEVFLVAIAVAMAIRTFFVQPFKIPTGSMQPTLFGITYENLNNEPGLEIPGFFTRVKEYCLHGVFYHSLVAADNGEILDIPAKTPPLFGMINRQPIVLRYTGPRGERTETHTLWFSPEDRFETYAGIHAGQTFSKGDSIVKLKTIEGDHLFVDRVTYNFRHPRRGEIIVFQTKGILMLLQDQFYIKRMVALGGETVQIGADRHLVIDGRRLDAATPHFENVYSFTGEPRRDAYSGHVSYGQVQPSATEAPLYSVGQSIQVHLHHYEVMGDNTMNSFDSRGWGDFPEQNVIGKSFFVYWPLSNHGASRFGWGVR